MRTERSGVVGDDRHPPHARSSPGLGLAQAGEELVVDPVDDLHDGAAGAAPGGHRPHLERLGQQGVAGVGEALLGDRPRLRPFQVVPVDEMRMQLRHLMTGWVSLSWKMIRSGRSRTSKSAGIVCWMKSDRRGDEEVLLLQAQLLALRRGVLGVEHLGDVLGEGLCAHRLGIVASVEDVQVEGLGCAGRQRRSVLTTPFW